MSEEIRTDVLLSKHDKVFREVAKRVIEDPKLLGIRLVYVGTPKGFKTVDENGKEDEYAPAKCELSFLHPDYKEDDWED